MQFVTKMIGLSLGGLVMALVGGYYFTNGNLNAVMVSVFAGIFQLMAVFLVITKAKSKGFIKLFRDLKSNDKEYEKYIHFPDSFGKLRTLIGVVKQPGRVTINGLGDFDDKGSEYCWGGDRAAFALPHCGTTVDLEKALYTHHLQIQEGIVNYEAGIRKYLGETKYKVFRLKHRRKPEPDSTDIQEELESLSTEKTPENTLEVKMLGETVDFRGFVNWLKYAFSPVAMSNAIMQEKLWTKREELGYKDKSKAMGGYGKLILYVLFGLMIFLVVVGAMWDQIGPMFGQIFGGGAAHVPVNATGV